MKIIPKGYVREKNNNPVSFDEQGNLTDQITGEKGTMMLPGFTVTGISPETKAKNYSTSFDGTYGLTPRDIYGIMPIVGDALDLKDIGTDLYQGNYLRAGIGAGMFLLPNILEKPLKATGRFLLNKNYRNKILKQIGFRPHNTNNIITYELSKLPREWALRDSEILVRPSKAERQAFIQNFERELRRRPDEVLNSYSQNSYINEILHDNPEYTYYISTTGKDPSLQSTVDDFIRRQQTSLRGVHSSNKDIAMEALTSTQKGRPLRGGDRLGTYGGLYTSNSFGIADAFKNPERSTMDGYIGTLQADFNIDRNLPIDEQLRQTRNKIILSNNSLPLPIGMHERYLDRAKNRGGIAFEAQYARRDGSTLPVHERAYLPTSIEVQHPVEVIDLQYFPHSTNEAGRWGTQGVTHSSKDEELFIPRMLNNTTDFIDLSRTFLEGMPSIDYDKARKLTNEYSNIINSQIDKRNLLVEKALDQQFRVNKAKQNIRGVSIATTGIGGLIGTVKYMVGKNNYEEEIRNRKISILNKSSWGKKAIEELNNNSTIQTWEEYDEKLDQLYKKYIRIQAQNNTVQKHQQGGIINRSLLNFVKNDNTRVTKPIIQEKIPYKLKPNEFYFIDKKTGKRIIGRSKQEVVSSDNRNTKQRKQDQARTKQIQKKYEADKNYNEGLKTIGTLSTLAMPSTYIGPVFNNNGKSYLDNVISGEGTGNTAGNLAIDLAMPFGFRLFNKGISYPYKTSRGTQAIKSSSKSSYMDPSGIKITPGLEIEQKYPIYRDMKKSKHFTSFSEPYFEEQIDDKYVTLLGQLDAGKYSEYQAERIIQNMKHQGFDPDVPSSKIIHNGQRLYGMPSRMIREKSKEPINIYITDEPTNVIGFQLRDNGEAYARVYPNATPEKIRLTTIHEGVSHGTDDVVNTATDGAAADQYGRITKAVKDAGFARTKGTERWYELRSTMAEFMAKMFKKHTKAVPGSTCADVQDAVYKEIDNMSVNRLADELKSLNNYGRDYGDYLMQNPFEANKFKALLKYGMGISAPIGITTYGFKNK